MAITRYKTYTKEQLAEALRSRDVLTLKHVALLLGRSENALRVSLIRGDEWVPPMFKQGSRWVCRTSDYKEYLKNIGSKAEHRPRKLLGVSPANEGVAE